MSKRKGHRVNTADTGRSNGNALSTPIPDERKDLSSGISVSGSHVVPDDIWMRGEDSGISGGPISQQHEWVYSGIRAIAQNIASVPLKIGGGPDTNPKVFSSTDSSKGSELASVIENPNPEMSGYQLWESTSWLMNLDGMAFWVLDRESINQIPKEITVWRKHYFRPVFAGNVLLGWIFQDPMGGPQVPLLRSQLLIFKMYNPYDKTGVWGLSPLAASSRAVALDILASDWNRSFFENSAAPDGVISSEKRMTRTQANDLRKVWEDRHRGAGQAKKVGVLWGGMKYQQIGISQKDMDFLKQREWNRDAILATLKVPRSEIAQFEGSNRAVAQSQDKGFWQKTLIPFTQTFESTFLADFIPGLRGTIDKHLRIFFDLKVVPALQTDLTEAMVNAEKMARIGWTPNQINQRLELGFPDVEWGDTWYVNKAIAPIEQILSGELNGAKPSHPAVNAPNGEIPSIDDPNEDLEASLLGTAPRPRKETRLNLKVDRLAVLAHAMKSKLRTYIYRFRTAQLALLMKEKSTLR